MAENELATQTHHDDDHGDHPEDGPVVSRDISKQDPLTLTFAFIAGLGLTLMILAGAIGVIDGVNADDTLMGLLFTGGGLLLVAGGGAWAGIVRPWEAFPSVTEGYYDAPEIAPAHTEGEDESEKALATTDDEPQTVGH